MKTLSKMLHRFHRNESGSMLAEAVMVLPMIIWCYLAFFVYWDAYKVTNTAQKAAYTVADLMSREMVPLATTYVPGMRNLLRYLVEDQATVKLRVTSLVFYEGATVSAEIDADDRLLVQWSTSPDNAMTPYTNTTIMAILPRIPRMDAGDSVVLVETEMTFKPMFDVGMTSRTMKNFVVTRPRFVPKICMTGITC